MSVFTPSLSASSSRSTFSDVSFPSEPSPSTTPPPSSGSKTHAFFSSPFGTRSPSPALPPSLPPTASPKRRVVSENQPRSRTTDFFAAASSPPMIEVLPATRRTPEYQGQGPPSAILPPSSPPPRNNRGFMHLELDNINPDNLTGFTLRDLPSPTRTEQDEPTPRPNPFEPTFSKAYALAEGEETPKIPQRTPASVAPVSRIHKEEKSDGDDELHPNHILTSTASDDPGVRLRLVTPRPGHLSSVWLAEDLSDVSLDIQRKRSLRQIKRKTSSRLSNRSVSRHSSARRRQRSDDSATSASVSRKPSLAQPQPRTAAKLGLGPERVPGLIPTRNGPSKHRKTGSDSSKSIYLDERDGDMPSSPMPTSPTFGMSRRSSECERPTSSEASEDGRPSRVRPKYKLVAVKLTSRGVLEGTGTSTPDDLERDRTRVSFIREVEVLRHISHPNITPLLSYFTTKAHHALVLPYLPGGDLLGLVNSDAAYEALTESTTRKIFSDLGKAVGWMHGVGLVHRDIKLENILLTVPLTPSDENPQPTYNPSQPLVKLTDFGLSRFIDPLAPLLKTKCGSEAYAAPELVTSSTYSSGGYDPRLTDSWACGVVLYALACRRLPFGEGAEASAGARRKWLMRVARGDWSWPDSVREVERGRTQEVRPMARDSTVMMRDPTARARDDTLMTRDETATPSDELAGTRLASSLDLREVVERLLVRDTARRMRVGSRAFWACAWFGRNEPGDMGTPVDAFDDDHPLHDSPASGVGSLPKESHMPSRMSGGRLSPLHVGGSLPQVGDDLLSGEEPVDNDSDLLPDGLESDEATDDCMDDDEELEDASLVDPPEPDSIARQEVYPVR
ncbi:kinase-like domain-containing protein [Schizophyllum amplum]|uniref:non-specific serine/threonine protein kinase n=1 Tax=Schizophyllum amplum TaxID=97359 RepID=A0A550C4T8_9AGAR|nr:kinase-like domain-containing protein [Auriculariopsis ampla]